MGATSYWTFRTADRDIIKALVSVSETLSQANGKLTINIAQKYPQTLECTLAEAAENEQIKELISLGESVFWQVQVHFPQLKNASVIVRREDTHHEVTLNFNDQLSREVLVPMIAATRKHFPAYERTEATDKLLGDELAEFYRKREAGLLRLEGLTQRLTEENEEYRRRLDKEKDEHAAKAEAELQSQKSGLEEDHATRLAEIEEQARKLGEREAELDDRDSKHARRQIRLDLKDELKERSVKFNLTEETSKKRVPTHVLYCALILVSGALGTAATLDHFRIHEGAELWLSAVRLGISAAVLVGSIVFYIRWTHAWFRQHADEEFRLKRLELDIDRASWVVETAAQWQDERKTDPPAGSVTFGL